MSHITGCLHTSRGADKTGEWCIVCGATLGAARPSLLPTRIEQVRECVEKEAGRLAAVLGEDSRIVVQLRVQVRELSEIARLQRAESP